MDPISTPNLRPPFGLAGYRDLELSTQVLLKAAIERGLEVEIIDRSSNAVRLLAASGRSEIVVQATKTSRDTYVCTEIMARKTLTKILLREAGLSVPAGRDYQDPEQARRDFAFWQGQDCIVKPDSTNYGTAISRLERTATQQDFAAALELAFGHDSRVLVEQWIPGQEYRFLVIDAKLQAVLQRSPASVRGDGHSSIAHLVAAKNTDPWRRNGGKGRPAKQGSHISPLEPLELGPVEQQVLREQGLAPDTVPPAGQTVFLRHNSNISTGGDSLDMTAAAHPGYGRLAEACAQALKAQICGVDIISRDITAAPHAYAIIEANFNPVLYFHEYPAVGQPRPVAAAVLDLLFAAPEELCL